MKILKEQVLEALLIKNPKERFQALLKQLLAHKNATPMQKKYYNAVNYSPTSIRGLVYDVKKLYGIKDQELNRAKRNVKQPSTENVVKELSQELLDKLGGIDLVSADYNKELKPIAKQMAEELGEKPISNKKADLLDFINANYIKGPSLEDVNQKLTQVFNEAPEEVKQGIKLRVEFPFLSEEDCPDEFKILVSDKFTAYDNFINGREEIKAAVALGVDNDQLFEIAKKTVENFELNLEIYDELNYYQEHKEILGEHPIFSDLMLLQKVEKYSTKELTKRQKNLRTYISRDTKLLDQMEEGEGKDSFAFKLESFKKELGLVDERLSNIK